MFSIRKPGLRRYVSLGLGAALTAASAVAIAPSPAPAAEFSCNPSFELCEAQYLFYSSSAKTTQVGYGEDPCEGSYALIWGEQTSHVTIRYFHCPF